MKFHPKLFPCDYFHISSFVRPSVDFILFITFIPFHSSFPFHSIPFHTIPYHLLIPFHRSIPFLPSIPFFPPEPTLSTNSSITFHSSLPSHLSIYPSLPSIPSHPSFPPLPSHPFHSIPFPFHSIHPSLPSHPILHFHPSIPSLISIHPSHPPSLPSTLPPSLPPSLRPIPFLPSGTSLPPFYSIPSHLFTPSSQKIRFITLRIRCNLTIRLRARSIEVLKARIDLIKTNLCSLFLQNY